MDAPRRLGRYELLHPIAAGGMATVFLGRAAGIGGFERLVAVKVCHPHLRGDPEFAAMFLDEARLAARIHHPNVVPVLDVGDDGALFFVMEYVQGVALSELIREAHAVPLPIVMRIARDLLAGLHAAHELRDGEGQPLNVVHRDVSPQNVLVGCDGVSRVVDFGVAKAEARATVTKGGAVKGKIGYMPPEQFLGKPVGRRADIYATAVVIWESLAGVRLFDADSDAGVMNLVLRGQMRPWPTNVPALPESLQGILSRALSVDPQSRFHTANEMLAALEDATIGVATANEVGAWVQSAGPASLRERRRLVMTVSTQRETTHGAGKAGSTTLFARWRAGHLIVVPRRWIVSAGVLTSALVAAVLWALIARGPTPVATKPAKPPPPPVQAQASQATDAPASALMQTPPVLGATAPKAGVPSQPPAPKTSEKPRVKRKSAGRAGNKVAKTPQEFRPTEL